MIRNRLITVAVAGLAAAVLVPSAAQAAFLEKLTAEQTTAEMTALSKATDAASANGWKSTVKATEGGKSSVLTVAGDPQRGITAISGAVDGESVRKVITKSAVFDSPSVKVGKALVLLGHPNAKYCKGAAGSGADDSYLPSTMADLLTGVASERVDDGDVVTYSTVDGKNKVSLVTNVGVLQSYTYSRSTVSASGTFAYGAQPQVTVPDGKNVVGQAVCDLAAFRVDPKPQLRGAARNAVALNGFESKKSIATVRKNVKAAAADLNGTFGSKPVTVKNVTGGAQMSVVSLPSKKAVTVTVVWNAKKKTAVIK